MSETKPEFLERKRSEKKNQARKQVQNVYDTCFAGTYTANGELLKWRIKMEPEMEEIYSTNDVCHILGIAREKLRAWMVDGFVTPSLPSTGKGTIAIFTKADLVLIKRFIGLLNRGFKRKAAARIIKQQSDEVINKTEPAVEESSPVTKGYTYLLVDTLRAYNKARELMGMAENAFDEKGPRKMTCPHRVHWVDPFDGECMKKCTKNTKLSARDCPECIIHNCPLLKKVDEWL